MAGFARRRYTLHRTRAQTLEDWTAAWQLIVVAGGRVESYIGGLAMPRGDEFHNRMRSTSLSVISSFVRS
jgi:hypothetical protein